MIDASSTPPGRVQKDRHVFGMTYYHYPETPEVMRLIAAGFFGEEGFDRHPWNVQPWEDWTANAVGSRKHQDWMDRFRRLAGLREVHTGYGWCRATMDSAG